MKISCRFTVAIHILALLSCHQEPCTSEYISKSVNTNPVVIRRLIGMLKESQMVQVTRGTKGTVLMRPLQEITLLQVYQAVDVVEGGALFQFQEDTNQECPVGANIQGVLQLVLNQAQEAMEGVLAQVTMAEIVYDMMNNKD